MNDTDAALDALVAREKQSMARDVTPPPNGLSDVRRAATAAVRWKTLSYVGKASVVALVLASAAIGLPSLRDGATTRRAPATSVPTPVAAAPVDVRSTPIAPAPTPSSVAPTVAAPAVAPVARPTRPESSAAHVDAPSVAPATDEVASATEAEAAPTPEPTDSLAEELRLLRAAQAALRSGDAARALAITAEHADRFPTGALAPERRALERRARCREGITGEPRPSDCP